MRFFILCCNPIWDCNHKDKKNKFKKIVKNQDLEFKFSFSVIARPCKGRGNLYLVKDYLQRHLLIEGIPTVGPLPSLGMTRGASG